MKLVTKEILKQFKSVGYQGDKPLLEQTVVAIYFNPSGGQYWFMTEWNEDEKCFFGFASLFADWNDELGSIPLADLENYKGRFGLGIERDLSFTPKTLRECLRQKRGDKYMQDNFGE